MFLTSIANKLRDYGIRKNWSNKNMIMEDLSTPERIYKRDGNLILRTAEIDDANMIGSTFKLTEYLKPWEPIREDAFLMNGLGAAPD